MGGAIEQLVDLEGRPSEERRTIPSDLLKYVEKIASQVLQDHGMKPGEMCANLAIKRVGADFLHITHLGTRLPGRSKRALPIDYGTPSPGAVEAYVFHSVAYVNDTHAEKFKQHLTRRDLTGRYCPCRCPLEQTRYSQLSISTANFQISSDRRSSLKGFFCRP